MNGNGMKKRWLSLYVENQDGVLSKISGLFSGKSYNIDSLTVGTTEDPTISRMTIATVSDDETFEQIKKQLNRLVEVIKVIDFTNVFVRMKEIMYIKVKRCTAQSITFFIIPLHRYTSYLSIMLMDSMPTLPPRTTSMILNSSFISFTTASFFVAVCTNSKRRLSFP